MAENIEHHVDEEEGEMFRDARQVFDSSGLEVLGQAMADRKLDALREEAAGQLR